MVNDSLVSGDYVLDSYAMLAWLGAEPGSDRVRQLLEAAREGRCRLFMSLVNFGEVVSIVERERGLSKAQETLVWLDELPIEFVGIDRVLALAAAHLKAGCPIAYADCYAAGLAQIKRAVLVTGDTEFTKIKPECGIRVEWLAEE